MKRPRSAKKFSLMILFALILSPNFVGISTQANLVSSHLPVGDLCVQAFDAQGDTIFGALVWVYGLEEKIGIISSNGFAILRNISIGPHIVHISAEGFSSEKREVIVIENRDILVTFRLERVFTPSVDGLGFTNSEFNQKMKSLIRTKEQDFVLSSVFKKIPEVFYSFFDRLFDFLLWTQGGYCGGMTYTVQQYFENESLLPEGYSRVVAIEMSDPAVNRRIIVNQYFQIFEFKSLFKELMLREGYGSTGLVPNRNEIDWILEQLDQNCTVRLTVIDLEEFEWYIAHSVLAYNYKDEDNLVSIDVYGPNKGAVNQSICLLRGADGDYDLLGGKQDLDSFDIERVGCGRAPFWWETWVNLLFYSPELISNYLLS